MEKVIIFLVILVVPLVVKPLSNNLDLIKVSFLQLALLTLISLAVFKILENKKLEVRKGLVYLPVLLFFIFLTLSLSLTANFFMNFPYFIFFICYIGVFLLVRYQDFSKKDYFHLSAVLVLTGCLLAVYGMLQYFNIDFIDWQPKIGIVATLGNPDALANFLVIVLPVILGLFFYVNNKYTKALLVMLFVFVSVCLTFTFSRSGWLSFFLSMGIFLAGFLYVRKKEQFNAKWKELAVFILIITFLTIPLAVKGVGQKKEFFKEKVTGFLTFKDENLVTRYKLWGSALDIMMRNPLVGCGLGNFSYTHLLNRKGEVETLKKQVGLAGHPHNEYFFIGATAGIPALLIFLWIIGNFIGGFRKTLGRAEDENYFLFLGLGTGCLAHLIHSFFNPSSFSANVIFWLLMALLIYKKDEEIITYELPSFNPILEKITMGLALIGIAFFMLTAYQLNMADVYFKKSQNFFNEKKYDLALEYCQKAINYNFYDYSYHLRKGKINEAFLLDSGSLVINHQEQLKNIFRSYSQAIRLNPPNPYPYTDLGRFLVRYGYHYKNAHLLDEGVSIQKQGIKLDPYNPIFHHDLAISYLFKNDLPEAEKSCLKALEIHPNYDAPYRILAGISEKRGNLTDSEKYLKKALSIDNKSGINNYDMGMLYFRQKKYQQAVSFLEEAYKLYPTENYYQAWQKALLLTKEK